MHHWISLQLQPRFLCSFLQHTPGEESGHRVPEALWLHWWNYHGIAAEVLVAFSLEGWDTGAGTDPYSILEEIPCAEWPRVWISGWVWFNPFTPKLKMYIHTTKSRNWHSLLAAVSSSSELTLAVLIPADAVHTLICAILLLNSDLHGEVSLVLWLWWCVLGMRACCSGINWVRQFFFSGAAFIQNPVHVLQSNSIIFISVFILSEMSLLPLVIVLISLTLVPEVF